MVRKIALFFFLMLVLAGCGRKHIQSTPAGAPEPTVIESTVDVEAHADKAAAKSPATSEQAATAASAQTPEFTEKALEAEETAVEHEKAPATESVETLGEGLFYIQVGAFEDPDKARTILAGLMSDGYSGSRMIKDGALLKVQAGGFADEAAARNAKARFAEQYPGCFLTR